MAPPKAHLNAFDVLIHWPSAEGDGQDSDLVTESCTSNIAIHDPQPGHRAEWVTPRHSPATPFLRGVMRQELIERGQLREEDVTVRRLQEAVRQGKLVVGMNGLRYARGGTGPRPSLTASQGRMARRGRLGLPNLSRSLFASALSAGTRRGRRTGHESSSHLCISTS